jgi:hypothetical protein
VKEKEEEKGKGILPADLQIGAKPGFLWSPACSVPQSRYANSKSKGSVT